MTAAPASEGVASSPITILPALIDFIRRNIVTLSDAPVLYSFPRPDLTVFLPPGFDAKSLEPAPEPVTCIHAACQEVLNKLCELSTLASNPLAVFSLASSIDIFCHCIRSSRFLAPSLLQTLIDDETSPVLLSLTHCLQALAKKDQSSAIGHIQKIQALHIFQAEVVFTMTDIARQKVRKYLYLMQRTIVRRRSEKFQDGEYSSLCLAWSPSLAALIETATQILSYLHAFICNRYEPDDNEPLFMANACLLSGHTTTAAQDLVFSTTMTEARRSLTCFWVSCKALIDLLAGEEQFGDEPLLQSTRGTGRQIVFHHLKKLQQARNKIREEFRS
uniref:Uncharacterized protein n=1 Tax=Spongospora subterranea TaxID=70186 RepID=A0A0H5RM64_9EUKA|eukprot:CRZ09789.1 hypothetical protein [Spongospora subterranea]